MARMFRPYRPGHVIGDFTRANEFYAGDDVRMKGAKLEVARGRERFLFARMFVERGRHYFQIKRSDGQWVRYPVDYTIGSKWQQAYATRLSNGQIHVFPVQYNVLHKRWINFWRIIDTEGSERADVRSFERLSVGTSYQANCAVCHTSQLQNTKGRAFEPDNLEFREPGVNCEMCHGPSSRHVSAMTAGRPYVKEPTDPPVDFNRISSREYVGICAQCHMQSALRQSGPHGELNYSGGEGKFFQRSESRPFGEFSRKAFYKDGRFRETTFIVESLLRSACFKKGEVNCGHCHAPHGENASSNSKSLKFLDQPDQMCLQCHSQYAGRVELHTRHPARSEASRCVSCHMPPIMNSLLFSARTHQIDGIPNAEMTLRFGPEDSPNACLLCHSDKGVEWTNQQLQARVKIEPAH
jgi:predicted CXXCH cytochrome family protein